MDASGEVADLMIKEGLQASETAVKLTASGIKNVAALLAALAQSDRKITGRASAKKLTKDPTPAVVLPLKAEDVPQFERLAKKDYGILYVIARPNGKTGGTVDIISNERYAAKLNALYQALGYPLPEKSVQEEPAKKAKTRAPQEKSLPERGNGSKQPTKATMDDLTPKPEQPERRPSVRSRLAALEAASKGLEKAAPIKQKERTR